ncbi:hypothetical protein EYF80_027107 [Liparis tanakae]|uniref:Uncharacterized protein n=1 Tax=Liparis tanakae TaxID=230148 RepID=A0A4Z2HA81_9TELE|nr:hypothetical protein EYF80_027107 [Liparis tanakae]
MGRVCLPSMEAGGQFALKGGGGWWVEQVVWCSWLAPSSRGEAAARAGAPMRPLPPGPTPSSALVPGRARPINGCHGNTPGPQIHRFQIVAPAHYRKGKGVRRLMCRYHLLKSALLVCKQPDGLACIHS